MPYVVFSRTYEYLSKNPVPRAWTHIAAQGRKSAWTIINPAFEGWPRDVLLHPEMAHWCSVPLGDDVKFAPAPPVVCTFYNPFLEHSYWCPFFDLKCSRSLDVYVRRLHNWRRIASRTCTTSRCCFSIQRIPQTAAASSPSSATPQRPPIPTARTETASFCHISSYTCGLWRNASQIWLSSSKTPNSNWKSMR